MNTINVYIHMHHTHTLYYTILTFMADIVHKTSPASTRAPVATNTFSTTPRIGLTSYITVEYSIIYSLIYSILVEAVVVVVVVVVVVAV